jgi:AGZA family xanthine/uracil permease-like MFS transporter
VEAEAQRIARPASASDANPIARYFRFAERGTNFATEIKAGVTTFMVMVYIVAVNPLILSNAGIDIGAAAAATALVAGVMTILMGVVANFPIAIAAGLGINGVVAFGLVLAQGLTPAGAMGVIVMEGLAITLLVIVGLREAVMNAVPLSLKRAIAVGIGLFILFIGFVDAGLIRQPAGDGPVPVEFVFPNTTTAWVALIGLLITIVLFVRRVPAALLLSIVITSVIAFLLGVTQAPETFSVLPNFSTLGAFDFSNVFVQLGLLAALLTIFTIMLADFFDTMGTGTAIAEQAGLVTPDGKLPGVGRLLLVDSVAAAAGGAAGISSNTSYIESAAGVAEGGRTGFTSVIVGVLFLLAIFVSPLVELVPFAATAPVLIVVGYLMALFIRDIDFRDVEEGFPALLALILMPLTFNITIGIGAGFVAWVVIKLVRGKVAQIHPLMWVVSIAFAVYFAQAWINAVLPASA